MRELYKNVDMWGPNASQPSFAIIVYKEGSNYYQVSQPGRLGSFDLGSLPKPSPIPLKLFMGRWEHSLTEAPHPLPLDSYLKSPLIILLTDDYDKYVARADENEFNEFWAPWHFMVAEARIYEILKEHPHPNICVYYGCVRDGDYFTALCLKKYARSLEDAVSNGDHLDVAQILDGVSDGLHFLHDTLGLVHGDINPANIMLDDNGNAVIIDFDSCMPIGEEIGSRKAGTPFWERDPEPVTALPENDWHGWTLLSKFMKEGEIWYAWVHHSENLKTDQTFREERRYIEK